jgi:hypothetical protein
MTITCRCYLLDHDRIAATQILERENDSAALTEAARMLIASPCTSAELWERDRKVSS